MQLNAASCSIETGGIDSGLRAAIASLAGIVTQAVLK